MHARSSLHVHVLISLCSRTGRLLSLICIWCILQKPLYVFTIMHNKICLMLQTCANVSRGTKFWTCSIGSRDFNLICTVTSYTSFESSLLSIQTRCSFYTKMIITGCQGNRKKNRMLYKTAILGIKHCDYSNNLYTVHH